MVTVLRTAKNRPSDEIVAKLEEKTGYSEKRIRTYAKGQRRAARRRRREARQAAAAD